MTTPAPSLPSGRDGLLTFQGSRQYHSRHSVQRAATHRNIRARFDRFRATTIQPTCTAQEFEAWNSNIEPELTNLDNSILSVEEQALRERETKSVVPRIGYLASERPEGVWRFAYCQLNNMSGAMTRQRKIHDLVRISNEFDVDGFALCEIGVNWSAGRGHSLKSWCSPHFSQEIRCTTAHNVHTPRTSLSQPGGTGLLITQSLLEYARSDASAAPPLPRASSSP